LPQSFHSTLSLSLSLSLSLFEYITKETDQYYLFSVLI